MSDGTMHQCSLKDDCPSPAPRHAAFNVKALQPIPANPAAIVKHAPMLAKS
jgi:hypothetical protein